ncbi:MAG TPA: TonB-dependent receptor [Longimicrobiales bacterium]|nr:TonB-dependent receptor [Longimicrobiales bacterium]
MTIQLRAAAALAAVAAATVLPAPGGAQAPDTLRQDTVYAVEAIAVRAVRPSTTTGGVSALVLRLDSVRMRPAPLLEDILRDIPLVQVRTNSRGEAQIAMRGAEERQVAILLDGVPLTLGWDHRSDLSVIPLTAARSITVVRGLASILHGPNVLGGAVEIGLGSAATARPDPWRIAAGMDQNGGYSVAAETGAAGTLRGEPLVVRAGAGHRDRPGFAAPPAVEAVYPALARDDLRVNSQSRLSDAFVTARYGGAGAWVAATGTGYSGERGVPPELTEDGPRLWRYPSVSRAVGILTGGSGSVDTPAGPAELTFSLGADGGRTRIHDFALPAQPASESDPEAFFRDLNETEHSEDLTLTARVLGSHALTSSARVRAALTYADISHDEVVTTGLAGGSPAESRGSYRQRLWSAGAELDIPFSLGSRRPIPGGRIGGGLAWDGADTPETGGAGAGRSIAEWGGRLGVSGTSGSGALMLHAAASRRGRFPALREMYSTALGRFEPNPGLRPEILTAMEAGFTTRRGAFDLQLVGFHQELRDAIVRGPAPVGSPARFQRINRDEIRSTGIELLAGYAAGRLTLETELTLQDVEARVGEPGAAASVRAEYEPEIVGGIGGSVPLPLGVEAGAEVEYVGRQYCATPVSATERYAQLDPSTRADVQLARSFRVGSRGSWFGRLALEAAVDNLTDSAIYDQCGLPQPGRTLRLQMSLR